MQLEQEFIDQRNVTGYTLEKRFNSKRNSVYLVRVRQEELGERYYVVKEYPVQDSSIDIETELLQALYKKGVSVPRVYYRGIRSVVMEYIKSPTLLDVMTDAEYTAGESYDYINTKGMASHFARWLEHFYKAAEGITGKRTILWDINLRNFLVGYKLYGIDFEDCREGIVEEDMGRLMAYIVTYEPSCTLYKINFAREVYNALDGRIPLDRNRVMAEMLKEFDAIRGRRDMEIPGDIAERVMTEDLSP